MGARIGVLFFFSMAVVAAGCSSDDVESSGGDVVSTSSTVSTQVAGEALETTTSVAATTSSVAFTTTVAPPDDVATEVRSQRTYIRDLFAPGTPGVPNTLLTLDATPTTADLVINTAGLPPGHALTAWVIVLDRRACTEAFPAFEQCQPWFLTALDRPDLGNIRHLTGGVTSADGSLSMSGSIAEGVDPTDADSGWWYDTPLPDLTDAVFHISIHDHGPVIDGEVDDMIGTYRGGCTDESALADAGLPDVAFNDGKPGPNTCTNPQAAPFEPDVDLEVPPPPVEFVLGSLTADPAAVVTPGVHDFTVIGEGFRPDSDLLIFTCTAPGPALVPGESDLAAITAAIGGIRGLFDCRLGESVPASVGPDGAFTLVTPIEVTGTPDPASPDGTNLILVAGTMDQSQTGFTWIPVVPGG